MGQLGFEAYVIEDLTRGIAPTSIDATNTAFATAGVQRIASNTL